MDLAQALRLSPPASLNQSHHFSAPVSLADGIAFVGAGGKSTAIFSLARSLSSKPPGSSINETSPAGAAGLPVIVTATSHLHIDQVKLANAHWVARDAASLSALEKHLHGVILVTGPLEGDRTTAVDPATLDWLHALCGYHDIPLLIEADGSRRHPLKAPAGHEPPIPPFIGFVVVVAGLSALGRPISAEFVHRPEIFASLCQQPLGSIITPGLLLEVLLHPLGGLKNIPAGARRVVLLNQASTPALQAQAKAMAETLIPTFDSILITSLDLIPGKSSVHAVVEPCAGIVLAAGEARRFGSPKQLLDFHGQPFVRRVACTALSAGLSPVVVITGANAGQVEAVLSDLPVKIVHNPAWESGQSSSIRAGLEALPAGTGAAVFLLADQPQVLPTILRALLEQHSRALSPVVAPMVDGRRANPVLFDRLTFPDLLSLRGDVGGRAVFSKFPPDYIPWHDSSLLLDIDTPDDLKKLQGME
jgi:molybdenum cofactor cytidylyltransferase